MHDDARRSTEPVAVTEADLKRLVEEIAYDGSQVDTLLLCINAQVMYYPTKVGTLRGTLSTPEERPSGRPASDCGSTPCSGISMPALIRTPSFLRMRRRGREALLSFRMNDDHGNDFLRTQFRVDHPDCHLGAGALDFGQDEVREYIFRLIEEAVERYDCDGIELDFNRFPRFFRDGTTDERVAKMNSLVERVRQMIDAQSKRRGRRLVLAVRVPSNFGRSLPTPQTRSGAGLRRRRVGGERLGRLRDRLEFLHEQYNLPLAEWKRGNSAGARVWWHRVHRRLVGRPVFVRGKVSPRGAATLERRSGRHLFVQLLHDARVRCRGVGAAVRGFGPTRLWSTLEAAERGPKELFVATPLTAPGSFTSGVEGPACDAEGNIFAVNFAREQTIGRVTPSGRASLFVDLPGKSTGNGIRFDRQGRMYVADYVAHNVLRIDPKTRDVDALGTNRR